MRWAPSLALLASSLVASDQLQRNGRRGLPLKPFEGLERPICGPCPAVDGATRWWPLALAAALMAACDGRSVVGGIAEDSGKADVFDLDADAVVDVTPVPDADVVAVDVGAPDRSDAIVDTGLPYCTSDEQCGAGSGAPYCDPVLCQCVRCVPGERDRCPAAQHCDPMAFACVDGCRSDEGCAGGATSRGSSAAGRRRPSAPRPSRS